MGGAYKGPTGSDGAAYGRATRMPEIPKSSVTFRRVGGVDKASPSFGSDVKAAAKDTIKDSVKIGAGAAAGAGYMAKKKKDAKDNYASQLTVIRQPLRKPRMADAPPKINPRKAYEE